MAFEAVHAMSMSMQDPHLELVTLLQDKESPSSPADVNSIKEEIRSVADRLRRGSTDDDRLDAAFAYYVSGYYVRASRLISQQHFDDIGNGVLLLRCRSISLLFSFDDIFVLFCA